MGHITNNTTTCHVEVLQFVAYTPLFILGLLLNATALWAFVSRRHAWTDTHVYMLNLAVADFALIVFLPFRMVNAFHCLRTTYLCTFLIYIHYVNMYASILTSTAISVHRFLLVRFPLRAKAWQWKRRTAIVVCVVIWVTVIALAAAYRRTYYPEKLKTCYERWSDELLPPDFLITLVVAGFTVPLLIIVCCSSQTILILWRDKFNSGKEKKHIVGIVTANMIVFIFCFTPVHVSLLLKNSGIQLATAQTTIHHVFLVSEWMATTNCCFDSISYYFLFKSLHPSAGPAGSISRTR
ncbi:hypothetical protein NHX12_004778 [Muraenolepis orangiensis]|uniref:G-protein coupled receptors family 1 profile domain-containing protein n=1 Tax=Muraenolepis orangiensis TaxID=630683 RepID=A0A9Q0DYE6_9TELE|nr:hypothetical protein NHX12_004778 [Muraenolepis orangiensis]